jgi:Flp pilus assembly pilin Flp
MLLRFIRDDGGQDLIEYALLAASIGLACVAVWPTIVGAIQVAYAGWDANIQSLSSCTPDPGGGGC